MQYPGCSPETTEVELSEKKTAVIYRIGLIVKSLTIKKERALPQVLMAGSVREKHK